MISGEFWPALASPRSEIRVSTAPLPPVNGSAPWQRLRGTRSVSWWHPVGGIWPRASCSGDRERAAAAPDANPDASCLLKKRMREVRPPEKRSRTCKTRRLAPGFTGPGAFLGGAYSTWRHRCLSRLRLANLPGHGGRGSVGLSKRPRTKAPSTHGVLPLLYPRMKLVFNAEAFRDNLRLRAQAPPKSSPEEGSRTLRALTPSDTCRMRGAP
jgi:hypothetical protein